MQLFSRKNVDGSLQHQQRLAFSLGEENRGLLVVFHGAPPNSLWIPSVTDSAYLTKLDTHSVQVKLRREDPKTRPKDTKRITPHLRKKTRIGGVGRPTPSKGER